MPSRRLCWCRGRPALSGLHHCACGSFLALQPCHTNFPVAPLPPQLRCCSHAAAAPPTSSPPQISCHFDAATPTLLPTPLPPDSIASPTALPAPVQALHRTVNQRIAEFQEGVAKRAAARAADPRWAHEKLLHTLRSWEGVRGAAVAAAPSPWGLVVLVMIGSFVKSIVEQFAQVSRRPISMPCR